MNTKLLNDNLAGKVYAISASPSRFARIIRSAYHEHSKRNCSKNIGTS